MKKWLKNPRIIWYIVIAGIIVSFLLFIPMNTMIKKLRQDEQKKVELWANAVSHKAELVENMKKFYDEQFADEQKHVQQFIDAYKIIISQSQDADLSSPELKFYTKIIMDNTTIPVIITDEFNNITLSQNVQLNKDQKVLAGDLLKKFSQNKPFEYEIYGMKFKLYYTASEAYTELRKVLDGISDLLLDEVTENTVFVPVIVVNEKKDYVFASGNMPLEMFSHENLPATIEKMTKDNIPIKIDLPGGEKGFVYYKKSPSLTLLKYYPVLYFFVLFLTLVLLFMVFRTMKMAEQNSVWIGMSKETAHQLGTPISSLMAWTEILRANKDNEEACKEIDKDIQKLDMVAQRFSQIGSLPDLKEQDIALAIYTIISYMKLRTPKNISYVIDVPLNTPVFIPLNKPLFEWSVENLIKNAADAMEGSGTITIALQDMGSHIHLDISDTGKGLFRTQFKQIFQPGYTTKKRGWGLGLSLVKRIIEEYHKGKIYVKSSTINKGTTFRIELPKK